MTPGPILITVGVIVGLLLVLEIWRYARNAEGNRSDIVPFEKLDPKHFATPDARVPMRNRFMGDRREDAPEIAALAAQITADQHLALERPGRVVHVPAPGEPGYNQPDGFLVVTAGAFTVAIPRGGGEAIITEVGAAQQYPYPMPAEWADVVAAFALELHRTRQDLKDCEEV